MLRLRVREIAEQRGLKLSQLQREAKLTEGVARRYWYGTRSGKAGDNEPLTEINLNTLGVIADVLQADPRDLLIKN
jgi:hypothetical protein